MPLRPLICLPLAALLLAGAADAQNLGGLLDRGIKKAKQKVEQTVENKVSETVDRSVDGAMNGATSSNRNSNTQSRKTVVQTQAPAAGSVSDYSGPTGASLAIPASKLPMAAAASWGTVVVNADGSVTAWPDTADGQPVRPVLPGRATAAAVHQTTAFILMEDGTVMGWGRNNYRSLGRDGDKADMPTPIPGLRDIVQVRATYGHALALRRDGAVFAWGEENDGLRGDMQDSHKPVTQVPDLPAIVQVATAAFHSLALGQDGRVYAWGNNGQGELGMGTTGAAATPAPVPGLDNVIAIAAGLKTSLALKSDGTVWAWGSNQSSMIGNGSRGESASNGNILSPVQVPGVAGAVQIVTGEGFVLALINDGTVRAWGFDGYGEIGVGTSGGYHTSPTRIPTLARVVNLNAGGYRVFATTADGKLWHWGTPIPVAPVKKPNVKVPVVLDVGGH